MNEKHLNNLIKSIFNINVNKYNLKKIIKCDAKNQFKWPK